MKSRILISQHVKVVEWFSLKRNPIPILVSILLIFTVLGSTLILSVSSVFASPLCGTRITRNTTLTANIGPCSGTGLYIGKNGITLNCAGHTITGSGSANVEAGIGLYGITKATVKNCDVKEFALGIYIEGSSSNTITGNTATNNVDTGFAFCYISSKNKITGNTANSNGIYGFAFCVPPSGSGNILTRNTANSNEVGYDDGTIGSGTKGTANFYTSNECKLNTDAGAYPPNTGATPYLCTPQSP